MMADRVFARAATLLDVPALVDLMREFYAESAYPLDAAWAARAFSHLLADPSRGAVWLLASGGDTVGHVVLSVRFAMEFGGLLAYIDDLYVRPAHRRRGAAGAGLDALLSECRRRGCRAVEVEVAPDNGAAQALYRRYGLQPAGDSREHLRLVLSADRPADPSADLRDR